MRISLDHFKDYTSKAPPYLNGLIFVQSGVQKKDINCLVMWLRRMCADTEGLSFMLVTSTHVSKGSVVKKTIRTGKAGRPKTVIQGKKADSHCHGLIINENANNNIDDIKMDLQTYCKKRRDKRPNLKRQKVTEAWQNNLSIVSYMVRQADSIYRYGDYDFDYFISPYYMPPEPNNYDNILDFEEVHETYIQ
jgi:hypothetical protein